MVGIFKNPWLWVAVLSSMLLQVAIMYVPFLQNIFSMVPLSLAEWGMVVGVAFAGFVYLEVHKFLLRR
jgi:Ca2+-transporting ATPase